MAAAVTCAGVVAGDRGDLGLRAIESVRELQHLAVLGAQQRKRRLERRAIGDPHGDLRRVVATGDRSRLVERKFRKAPAPAYIDGFVMGDPEHPGRHARTAAEAPSPAPHRNHHVARDFLGDGGLGDEIAHEGEHAPGVAIVERAERALVARGDALDQRPIEVFVHDGSESAHARRSCTMAERFISLAQVRCENRQTFLDSFAGRFQSMRLPVKLW